jgi:hypothetical protein
MKLRRKAAAIMMMAAMLVGPERGRASAQGAAPDLRMLMNLDLFEPRANTAQGAPASAPPGAPTDDSMLDQIRTLETMGYLGNPAGAQASGAPSAPRAAVSEAPGAEDVAPVRPSAQTSPIAPGTDVEGPLP